MDELSRYPTPESAVSKAVDGAGGPQHVGCTLRAEWDNAPDTAGKWVNHCCSDGHRSKFSLRQLVWIFRTANRAGAHIGFKAFAHLCGYTATPILPTAQLVELQQRAAAALAEAQEAARDLQTLVDNPRLLASLRAANVNVDALA